MLRMFAFVQVPTATSISYSKNHKKSKISYPVIHELGTRTGNADGKFQVLLTSLSGTEAQKKITHLDEELK